MINKIVRFEKHFFKMYASLLHLKLIKDTLIFFLEGAESTKPEVEGPRGLLTLEFGSRALLDFPNHNLHRGLAEPAWL